ncbi:alpha/beta fold hydrolase [Humibacter ginsenosidimutans]|uniref:alpha/beta fold hydrolase n=1 Tax=Humibacter ginsenosidimutans TaxID=2599293 RepID=UPI001FED874B|nr:alpha/beta hydrolase [Humibacter ginsenosidimutans]
MLTDDDRGAGPRASDDDHARDRAVRADAALGEIEWAQPPEGTIVGRFEAPSGTLAMWSMGDHEHPPVVLVPGVTGSKEDFALLGPLLVQAGYRVVSYDLAGQYESADAGPGAGGGYDYDLFVDDLLAVLASSGAAHLLGYSFAGTVAQLASVRRPDLVRSLTLLTAPPLVGQVFRGVRAIGPLSRVTTAHQDAGLMIWGVVTNKNKVGPKRLRFVRDRFEKTTRESVDGIIALMRRTPDVAAELRALDLPILVATGEHDLWPVQLHAAFAQRLGASLAVYRTGHSPCETAPHQLAYDMLRLFAHAESEAS